MQLLQLRYFFAAATTEHFSDAARELCVSQSALSNTIAKLEKELGVKLFDRTGRQVRLNRYGAAFKTYLETAFAALDDGCKCLSELAGLEMGAVSVGIPSIDIISKPTQDFLAKYPEATFAQYLLSKTELEKQLLDGSLDYIITFEPVIDPGVICTPLIQEEIFILTPADHPLAKRSKVDLIEFAGDSFAITTHGPGLDDTTIDRCKAAGFVPKIGYTGPSGAKHRVALGHVVGFASELELETFPFFSRYVCPDSKGNMPDQNLPHAIRIASPPCFREIGIAEYKGRFKSAVAIEFGQMIKEFFNDKRRN